MASIRRKTLRVHALRIDQDKRNPLYMLSIAGSDLEQIADISRISRSNKGKLLGYQRPEVKRHVKEIVEYLNGEDVMFPHAIVLSLASSVIFKKSRGPQVGRTNVAAGVLEIPLPRGRAKKPAWIVDGQQRAIAVSRCNNPEFPIPVTAFISDNIELQRDQFMRVNNAKPLPRGLISEILPEVSTNLPPKLATRKIPASLCDLLARDPQSPFHSLIRRPSTPSNAKTCCVVVDTSVIKMVHNSLSNPNGALFAYRNIATGETDFDSIMHLLVVYWTAVKKAFPRAWGLPPTKSRLMHGAGIISMGRLMDRIVPTTNMASGRAPANVKRELDRIKPMCRWTSGHWDDLDNLPWNGIQNTPKHITMLSNVLLRAYLESRGGMA